MDIEKLAREKPYVVNVDSEKECELVLKVFESVGYRCGDSDNNYSPLEILDEAWHSRKGNLCVGLRSENAVEPKRGKLYVAYQSASEFNFEANGYEIIDFKEFCKRNNITKEKLNEINQYYE